MPPPSQKYDHIYCVRNCVIVLDSRPLRPGHPLPVLKYGNVTPKKNRIKKNKIKNLYRKKRINPAHRLIPLRLFFVIMKGKKPPAPYGINLATDMFA